MALASLKNWSSVQRHVVAACYFGWMLDSLDYFLLVFVLKDMAAEFHVGLAAVSVATVLTLIMRPVGAFLFGRLADHFGRRPVLMINIAIYSLLSFSTAFVPSLFWLLVVRALFGIGMGGVWGIGASLSMETINSQSRGFVSGLLQSGYASGYLLASIVYGLVYVHVGWRGMFMVGILPALALIPYIYAKVPESPVFKRLDVSRPSTIDVLRRHWKLALYAVLLMTAFNFLSHGTQDYYPTFLQKDRHLGPSAVSFMAILYNIGAVCGGLIFGTLSQRFGRRATMITAALLTIPTLYLWAFSPTGALLTMGAFMMSFFVTSCWSAIPAHLNELSPAEARGTFPGTVYQLGNVFASVNLTVQVFLTERFHSYSVALVSVAFCAALAIVLLVSLGPAAHNAPIGKAA